MQQSPVKFSLRLSEILRVKSGLRQGEIAYARAVYVSLRDRLNALGALQRIFSASIFGFLYRRRGIF